MVRKKLSGLLLGCMATCAFIIVAAGNWYGKTVELTYSNVYPATHGNLVLANEWCKEIEKRNKRSRQNPDVSRRDPHPI